MALSKEDQNTFILIGGILIVCLIAIIAIFSGIWALLREPVNTVTTEINELIRRTKTYDYNFPIPEETHSATSENPKTDSSDVDYNFPLPEGLKSFEGAVLTREQLVQIEKGEDINVPSLNIEIKKLGINSKILQGNDSESILKEGFWLAPISNTLGKGQILLFCHRTYFGPNDPRSCWYADSLSQGDEVIIKVNNSEEAKYKILSVDTVETNNELIYKLDPDKDLIKIVTFTPRETGTQRLEIIAVRIE